MDKFEITRCTYNDSHEFLIYLVKRGVLINRYSYEIDQGYFSGYVSSTTFNEDAVFGAFCAGSNEDCTGACPVDSFIDTFFQIINLSVNYKHSTVEIGSGNYFNRNDHNYLEELRDIITQAVFTFFSVEDVSTLDEEEEDFLDPNEEIKEDTMTEKKTTTETVKTKAIELAKKTGETVAEEATDSAWLAAAMVIVERAKTPVTRIGAKFLPKELVASALETSYGEAGLAYGLGVLFPLSPFKDNPKAMKLGSTLRVYGGAILMKDIVNKVFDPLRDVLLDVFETLPDDVNSGE